LVRTVEKAPSHRLLAMLRAENEGFIKFKVEVDLDEAYDIIELVLKQTVQLRHTYN
jgi:uncharacterized protein